MDNQSLKESFVIDMNLTVMTTGQAHVSMRDRVIALINSRLLIL